MSMPQGGHTCGLCACLPGMFKRFCAFLSLLKFDTMMSVIVLLMMKFLTVSIDSSDLPLGIVTLVVSIVWYDYAVWAMRVHCL